MAYTVGTAVGTVTGVVIDTAGKKENTTSSASLGRRVSYSASPRSVRLWSHLDAFLPSDCQMCNPLICNASHVHSV